MKTAVGIAFAAAFATVVPLSAQEVKQTLSLDEAIAVTLTENPAMKAAEFEEKASVGVDLRRYQLISTTDTMMTTAAAMIPMMLLRFIFFGFYFLSNRTGRASLRRA